MKFFRPFLSPGWVILSAYFIGSFLFITLYIYRYSFVWEFVTGVRYYVAGLLVVLAILLFIATALDKRWKWSLKRYFIISFLQLIVLATVAYPVREWQINSSFEKAKRITGSLETYRKQFGTYPETLDELEQKLGQEIPRRTNIGTQYWYRRGHTDGSSSGYRLDFMSYHGYRAYYNIAGQRWILTD